MKNSILFLLFQCAVLVTVTQPLKNETEQMNRNRRTLSAEDSTCSENQYFDKQEGRCFTVIGGGKVIDINNSASCGTNVLKPHRTDPNYYYICKWNKAILVQCPHDQQFANRLQKCVSTDEENSTPSFNATAPLDQEIYNSEFIRVPPCEKSGSFRIPSDCTLFYTCETSDQQMLQKIFKCPKNMLYDAETELCRFSSTSKEKLSNSYLRFCVSNVTKETIAQKYGTETKKTNDSADKRNSISEPYSTRFETSDSPNESSTVANYFRNTFLNLNNDESTTNDGEFSSTTVSYTEPMPSDLTQSNDGYDDSTATDHFPEMPHLPNTVGSTSTTYPTINVEFTTVKETSPMEEETSESSLEIIPLPLLRLNEEYNSITTEQASLSTTEHYEDTQTTTEVGDSTFPSTTLSTDLLMSTDKSNDETTQSFSPTETTPISDETTINRLSSSNMNDALLSRKDDITTEIYSEENIENSTQQTNELSSTTEMESTTMMSVVSSIVHSAESTANITEAFNNYDKTLDELLKEDVRITIENSTNANNPKLIINTGDEELDSSITQALSRCLNNTLLQTLAIISSSESAAKWNSSNNDTNSKSFNMLPYSPVVDNELNVTSKQNEYVAGKQSKAALNMTYFPRTISRKYALPLASAVLNITERFERRMRNGLQQLARGNA